MTDWKRYIFFLLCLGLILFDYFCRQQALSFVHLAFLALAIAPFSRDVLDNLVLSKDGLSVEFRKEIDEFRKLQYSQVEPLETGKTVPLEDIERKVLVSLDSKKWNRRSLQGISKEIDEAEPYVRRTLTFLVSKGLVERSSLGHGRHWFITQDGRAALTSANNTE